MHIAVGRKDGVVIVLDRSGKEVTRFSKVVDAPLAFAPDGTLWIGAARYGI